MNSPTLEQREFAAHLASLAEAEDRGALAALRRGLGKPPGTAAEMYRHVVPWLPEPEAGEDWGYYLVAALFGLHPQSQPTITASRGQANIGASFASLRRTDEITGIDRRFEALLDSHSNELPEHLRQVVSLLKANDVPVDWAQLLYDVLGWDWPSRSVQQAWARAFWGARGNDSDTTGEEATSDEPEDELDTAVD